MHLASKKLSEVKKISLKQDSSSEGVLSVIQSAQDIPFKIERSFFIKVSQAQVVRGKHAHRTLSQFMICLSGKIEITVDDSRSKCTYELSGPENGILVPPGIWCEQIFKTKDSILLVLCDAPYNESDYIRDYEDFQSYVKQQNEILNRIPIRLNLGCGGRPLPDYINIDMDTLEQIRRRYPNHEFSDDLMVVQYDIFNLPYPDNSVDEIRADGLIEHLPFIDEPRFFTEIVRVVKPDGMIYLSTVDFEKTVREWLETEDDWKDFFRNDQEAILNHHWFGTYTYEPVNRWGYLTATIYGSQNGAGQFHTNCYTEKKLRAICKHMNLEVVSIERFRWKGDRDHMLGMAAKKDHKN